MEEKNIQVTVRLDLKDYWDFNMLGSQKSLYKGLGFSCFALLFNALIQEYTVAVNFLIFVIIYFIYIKRKVRKQFDSNKLMQKENLLTINAKGIEIITTDGSGQRNIKWEEIYEVKQDKNIIGLMTSKAAGHIIPRRLLNSEQIADLEELVDTNLKVKFVKTNRLKCLFIGGLIFVGLTLTMAVIKLILDKF